MAGLLQSANGKVNRYIISIRDRYLGDFAHHGRAYIGCKSKSCIGLTQSDLGYNAVYGGLLGDYVGHDLVPVIRAVFGIVGELA